MAEMAGEHFSPVLHSILGLIELRSEMVEPISLAKAICNDPDDDKFIEAAVAAAAELCGQRRYGFIAAKRSSGNPDGQAGGVSQAASPLNSFLPLVEIKRPLLFAAQCPSQTLRSSKVANPLTSQHGVLDLSVFAPRKAGQKALTMPPHFKPLPMLKSRSPANPDHWSLSFSST